MSASPLLDLASSGCHIRQESIRKHGDGEHHGENTNVGERSQKRQSRFYRLRAPPLDSFGGDDQNDSANILAVVAATAEKTVARS
jgi:hypothetical protein